MKPFHLHVQFDPEGRKLKFQWFGRSAIHAEGSCDFIPREGEASAGPPEVDWPGRHIALPAMEALPASNLFLIDLYPLLTEITAGTISDAEGLQAADEFLLLRDLMAADDFDDLCETLYHFLWREAQQGLALEGVRKGDDGKVRVDPATITASVPHIVEFLHELSEKSGAERIHLFAHSMNRLDIPQDRLAKRLGLARTSLYYHLSKMPTLASSTNSDLSQGFSVAQVAQKHGCLVSICRFQDVKRRR